MTLATTIMPFAQLPGCAQNCGPLYDANGACVPPQKPSGPESQYASCFCSYTELQPLATATPVNCADCGSNPADLSSLQSWYNGYCSSYGIDAGAGGGASATPSSSPSGSSGSGSKNHGSWISTHYQWVIMIVIVILGIAGIWAGACIWRRKYLKKKDRMYELGKGLPSSLNVNERGGNRDSSHSNQPGRFMTGVDNSAPPMRSS